MDVKLKMFHDEENIALGLIKEFWKVHNQYEQNNEEALKDLNHWTSEGHKLYFIC